MNCLNKYLAKDFDYQTRSQVKQIMGAFIFTRRDIIETLNGWDETYPIWGEDLDLCKRARNKGYKIFYLPISQVIHYEGKSFEQKMSLEKQILTSFVTVANSIFLLFFFDFRN